MTEHMMMMMCSSLEDETQLLKSDPIQFKTIWDRNSTTAHLLDKDYIEKINEVQAYLDKVKKIVGPGCSNEVLNIAISSMSSLVETLSGICSVSKPHASL